MTNKKLVSLSKRSYSESLNMKIFYDIISEEEMEGNIPRAIKVDVIREWLRGKSRDQIAKHVGIGAVRWEESKITDLFDYDNTEKYSDGSTQ